MITRLGRYKAMNIGAPRISTHDYLTEVRSCIGGVDLWVRLPSEYFVPENVADAMVAISLFPAMRLGGSLILPVDAHLSPELMSKLPQLQKIFSTVVPTLRPFSLQASASPTEKSSDDRIASFFSGGVDSLFTLLRQQQDKMYLLCVNGIDFETDSVRFSNIVRRNSAIAKTYGGQLIPIETNAKQFLRDHGIGQNLGLGSCLAAIGLLIGAGRTHIPASEAYDFLKLAGSHVLTDPLFSTGYTRFAQHGNTHTRLEKIVYLAEQHGALDQLLVCREGLSTNCGRCNQCVRTMLAFEVLGLSSDALPSLTRLALIRQQRFHFSAELPPIRECQQQAKSKRNWSSYRAISWALARYDLRLQTHDLLRSLDDLIFSGAVQSAQQRRWLKKQKNVPRIHEIPFRGARQ